jgi:hypothetical protein
MTNYLLMTKRHNRLINVVRKAVEKFQEREFRTGIQENERIEEQDLTEELRRMRPDMVFE